jgi:hypothetical protein
MNGVGRRSLFYMKGYLELTCPIEKHRELRLGWLRHCKSLLSFHGHSASFIKMGSRGEFYYQFEEKAMEPTAVTALWLQLAFKIACWMTVALPLLAFTGVLLFHLLNELSVQGAVKKIIAKESQNLDRSIQKWIEQARKEGDSLYEKDPLSDTHMLVTPAGRVFQLYNKTQRDGKPIGVGSYKCVRRAKEVSTQEIYASASIVIDEEDSDALETVLKEIENLQIMEKEEGFVHLHGYAQYTHKGKRKYRLILDYADMGDLYELISANCLSPQQKQEIVVQMLERLARLHRSQYLHRDLTLKNILIKSDKGGYKVIYGDLASFCLASDQEARRKQCTTLCSISPEYAKAKLGEKDIADSVTEKLDIWSLGCLIYEVWMGVGSLPWARWSEESRFLSDLAAYPDPTILKQIDNPRISFLVTQMLQQEPKNRPSCQTLLIQLGGL